MRNFLIVAAILAALFLGYQLGKRSADKWYQAHSRCDDPVTAASTAICDSPFYEPLDVFFQDGNNCFRFTQGKWKEFTCPK